MTKKKQGGRPRPRKRRRRTPPPRRPPEGPTLVTPEGDPMAFVRASYQLLAAPGDERSPMNEIARLLKQAPDFGEGNEVESPSGEEAIQFPWFETEPGSVPPQEPMERRILAIVSLTAEELEVETMSRQRMARCRRRLADLLGERIHLIQTTTKSAAQALAETPPEDAAEPLELPPEIVAQMEDRMLRRWLDESIPALDGMTPWEASRTLEGRQMLEDLFEYLERRFPRDRRPPGRISPDYRKAKKMLGLE